MSYCTKEQWERMAQHYPDEKGLVPIKGSGRLVLHVNDLDHIASAWGLTFRLRVAKNGCAIIDVEEHAKS